MNNGKQSDAIHVEIDIELSPIVPEFLEKRRGDCSLISQCLETGAFDQIHTLGHRMKGAGGSYGFDDISEIGETIEKAALEGDHDTIGSEVQRLSDYLDRVAVVYVELE